MLLNVEEVEAEQQPGVASAVYVGAPGEIEEDDKGTEAK